MRYENETCESCFLFVSQDGSCALRKSATFRRGFQEACKEIVYTLEARKVGAMERLADRFAPEVFPSMTDAAVRAAEAWIDYDAGRAGSDGFQQALSEYRRAKREAGKEEDE
jgi:hypothetical protein